MFVEMSLPEELLCLICWELRSDPLDFFERTDLDSNKGTLYSVMRASKALYRAACPVFYQSITIGISDGEIEVEHILQICIDRPYITNLIEEICVGYKEINRFLEEQAVPVVDLNAFLAATETIKIASHLRESIKTGLRSYSLDAMITLLLALCRRLVTVGITHTTLDSPLTLGLIEDAALEHACETGDNGASSWKVECKPLQRLQVLQVDQWVIDPYWADLEITRFLRLPSLMTLEASRCSPNFADPPFPENSRARLQSISLSEVLIFVSDLDRLLIACPNLRAMSIVLSDAIINDDEFDYEELGDVLRNRGSCLESFKLDAPITNDEPNHAWLIGQLKGLKLLRTLHLLWEALFGVGRFMTDPDEEISDPEYLVDTLPSSLEELVILQSTGSVQVMKALDNQLLALINSGLFQNLRLITIERDDMTEDEVSLSLQLPPEWQVASRTTLDGRGPWMWLEKSVVQGGSPLRRETAK